jgi:hypothetical protein
LKLSRPKYAIFRIFFVEFERKTWRVCENNLAVSFTAVANELLELGT